MTSTTHRWRFFRAGGFDQVRLDTGADLANLAQLDQKLWVALSCPTQGLELDQQTLALIDSDRDGHVRAPELIEAITWAVSHLKSSDTLVQAGPLPLSALDDGHDAGRRLLMTARRILASLGKPDATDITVEDCGDNARIFAGMAFNGDGVITAAGQSPAVQAAIGAIIDGLGGTPDRSGDMGVNRALVERFYAEGQALQAWRRTPASQPDCLPLGADTELAFSALTAVRDKIDDFFMRCQLAAFDPRAAQLLNGSEDALKALGAQLLSAGGEADMAALPLAYVARDAALPLQANLNPAWSGAMAQFVSLVSTPLLGAVSSLTESDWQALKQRFAAYATWLSAKPSTPLDSLDDAMLDTHLAAGTQQALLDLLAQDEAAADEAASIGDVERLVRYTRDLSRLANNFVSFTDFYTRRDKACFQAGTLYLDGRSCELCVKVLDPGRHAALATLSGVYLAYCECTRQGEKMTIAAAFTSGDSEQLMVGRNGVFYDRLGRDWDATITRIVEHPISIRQAFWTPYRKAASLVAEQAQKFAAARAKASDDLTTQAITKAGDKVTTAHAAAPTPAPQQPAPFDVAKFAGIFAAIGLAVGAIGTALASVVTGFIGLKAWQMPLALMGLMVLISGPAMLMAYFKLRKRNLGPILDANGWAVNTRARINIPFGTALTHMAQLPAGAERALTDPYGDKKSPWKAYVVVALLITALVASVVFKDELHTFWSQSQSSQAKAL
ncbi:MAG: hypothetical protein ACOYNB_01530 [Aquabacterium sp.]|uniref:hypothetical protein n=1 Tax=Aquabacterium sp. TaxID=1872578 RepID=UPI003BBE56D9